MSVSAKASFDGLPHDVLSLLLPPSRGPRVGAIPHSSYTCTTGPHGVMQLKQTREEECDSERRALLRSLAQVSKRLRNFALPLLWANVYVYKIAELGRLREVLRASPDIAPLIRGFSFRWDMDYDYQHYEGYPAESGSVLDMAFRDRHQAWEDLRKAHQCQLKEEYEDGRRNPEVDSRYDVRYFFMLNGVKCRQPGHAPFDVPGLRKLTDMWKPADRRFVTSGPDGKGEDRLIKSVGQFKESITDVLERLSNLEAFSWDTPIAPMPVGVYDALAKLNTLSSLHVKFSLWRGCDQLLPLWNLARTLNTLSISHAAPYDIAELKSEHEQLMETEAIAAAEIPPERPTTRESRHALQALIACHVFIAAAKTGNLRRASITNLVKDACATRVMLPCWASVDLSQSSVSRSYLPAWRVFWLEAATSFRPLLAHVSLWLDVTSESGARHDRRLTQAEIQQMQAHFENVGLPKFAKENDANVLEPVERYLAWLSKDEELAENVASAWNSVVERGGTNEVKCKCEKCKIYSRES